jgi:hypothetical protein
MKINIMMNLKYIEENILIFKVIIGFQYGFFL